jgi:hypothetical protein
VTVTLTDEDIERLRSGRLLACDVEEEYIAIVRYMPGSNVVPAGRHIAA